MHFVKVKSILSPHNGMNLTRGCTHGCIYCDSRSKCYQMDHPFEDIAVKENALELLEQTLKRRKQTCMIGTGAMSDPYTSLEKEQKLMRGTLELVEKYGFGITVLTKSTGILRDLDLLKRINDKTKAVVQMTLTTYDEELCRILEPHVDTTKEHFEALKQFRDAGIPTVVWLCPILPFINDTEDNLRGILNYCIEAEVKGIVNFGMGVTLREGNREYFYQKLDEHFPGMKERYRRNYGLRYNLPSPHHKELTELFRKTCKENNILCSNSRIFEYMNHFENKEFEQLSLF